MQIFRLFLHLELHIVLFMYEQVTIDYNSCNGNNLFCVGDSIILPVLGSFISVTSASYWYGLICKGLQWLLTESSSGEL